MRADPTPSCSTAIDLTEDDWRFLDLLAQTPPRPVAPLIAIDGFQILRQLGRGSSGVVYQARELALNRIVAVKVITAGRFASEDDISRFRREAEVAAVAHANVVQVYSLGLAGGCPFLVMEYCAGGSLAARIQRHGALQPKTAARLAERIALAVDRCHTRLHVLHRDIKPANILMRRRSRLILGSQTKLADFGVARLLDSSSTKTTIAGTPGYMAPEQARGQSAGLDARTDVYGLGATLYEMLSGRPPFVGETSEAILRQLFDSDPIPVRRLNPRVPRELETVCSKCLASIPSGRYTSAAELAADLRRFREGRPILARPISPIVAVAKWGRRRPAQAALLAFSVTTLVVGAVGVGKYIRDVKQYAADLKEERDSARTSLKRAFEAAEFALSDETLRQLAGRPTLSSGQKTFLRNVLTYYQAFDGLAADSLESEVMLGQANSRIGRIRLMLGDDLGEVVVRMKSAVACFEHLVASTPGRADFVEMLAGALNDLGSAQREKKEFDAARGSLMRSLTVYRTIPGSPERDFGQAQALANLGDVPVRAGESNTRLQFFRASVDVLERLVREIPDSPRYSFGLMMACVRHGNALAEVPSTIPESEAPFRRAVALGETLVALDRDNDVFLRGLTIATGRLGAFLDNYKRFDEVVRTRRRAVDLAEQLVRLTPGVPEHVHWLVENKAYLAQALCAEKMFDEADAVSLQAVQIADKLANTHADWPFRLDTAATAHQRRSSVLWEFLRQQGKEGLRSEIDVEFRRALELRQRILDHSPTPLYAATAAELYLSYAGFVDDTNPQASLEWSAKGVEIVERLYAQSKAAEHRQLLKFAHAVRGVALKKLLDAPDTSAELLFDCARWSAQGFRVNIGTVREGYFCTTTISMLRKAIGKGLSCPERIASESAFGPLRSREEFASLLWELAEMPPVVPPTLNGEAIKSKGI